MVALERHLHFEQNGRGKRRALEPDILQRLKARHKPGLEMAPGLIMSSAPTGESTKAISLYAWPADATHGTRSSRHPPICLDAMAGASYRTYGGHDRPAPNAKPPT